MHIASILTVNAVFPRLQVRDKKQVLKFLAAEAAERCHITEKEIFTVLSEREQAGCTGMGNGVCIPHGRFEHLDKPYAFFASLERPIEFGSADGRQVDIVFLLLTPVSANTEHIKALATASRLLRNKDVCKQLRDATTSSQLYSILTTERDEDLA